MRNCFILMKNQDDYSEEKLISRYVLHELPEREMQELNERRKTDKDFDLKVWIAELLEVPLPPAGFMTKVWLESQKQEIMARIKEGEPPEEAQGKAASQPDRHWLRVIKIAVAICILAALFYLMVALRWCCAAR
jgi:anti-sigma-K factor RskA